MPLIRKNYILSSYSNNSWIIEIFGQHFIINQDSKKLLDILSVSENYDEAVLKFNSSFNDNLNKENFLELVKNIFSKIPIFETDSEDMESHKNFIKFQKPIIKSKLAAELIYPFMVLFNKKIFWIFFVLLSIIATTIIITTPFSLLSKESFLWTLLLYTPTVLLHELGHIAACKKYTGKNGDIGVGIYFIFPVFYSDVSAVWHATKEERVIVNLSGIYMQLLSMLIFITMFFVLKNNLFLQMAYILAIYSFVQLIPFVRSDGYWLLSDVSSTPNLQDRSNGIVMRLLKSPVNTLKNLTPKNIFILLYGMFNTFILTYFIFTQIVFKWREIINFPFLILDILKKIFAFEFSQIQFSPTIITTIVFIMIIYNFVKKITISIIKKFST